MTGNGSRISVSSRHVKKLLVTVVILTVIIFCEVTSGGETLYVGSIVGEPSNEINVENTKSYSVYCVLTKAENGVNVTHLSLLKGNTTIKTDILNATTIVARNIKVTSTSSCSLIRFICEANFKENGTNVSQGIHSQAFYFGRPPLVIPPSGVSCIWEEQRHVHCHFHLGTKCLQETKSRLRAVSVNGVSECEGWNYNNTFHWDSRNGSCVLSMDELKSTFEMSLTNGFGKRTMQFDVIYDDIVRPSKPDSLSAKKVKATSANVAWNMPKLNVSRLFGYEFQMISLFSVNKSLIYKEYPEMIFSYLLEDLIPYTHYTFKVRVMVLPGEIRYNDDLYWSEYGTVSFKTSAHRPIMAPAVAYNFKESSIDLMNLTVFWESIPVHLHNCTGFGYNVTAYSDKRPPVTQNVNASTYTFNDLPIGHYRIRIFCFNDEGESTSFSEIQIFSPMDNRQPQLRSVLKDGRYNVSWNAPKSSNLYNYTLLYCRYTSEATCQDTIRFVTVPPDRTFFAIAEETPLNFAISANYADNYSSELSWQQCVTAPRTFRLGNPKLLFESVTSDSMVVRMMASCEEHSFYARMQICVRTMDGQQVLPNKSYDHYVEKALLDGLKSSTKYQVIVSVYDGFGNASEEMVEVCTNWSGIWILVVIVIIFGATVAIIIVTVVGRRLRFLLDIQVDLPDGLLKDQEDPEEESEAEYDNYEIYYNMPCPVIPEEPETIAEEIVQDLQSVPIPAAEYVPVELLLSTDRPLISGCGPYIEMSSLIRPSNTGNADGNGNYEQMHPPVKSSPIVVRSTGYVKIDLFINRARTGNYTQTIV